MAKKLIEILLPVCTLVLVFNLVASLEVSPDLIEKCNDVVDKLESYSLNSKLSSGLKVEELKAAFEEINQWTYQEASDIKREFPMIHLLADILPMLSESIFAVQKGDVFSKGPQLYITKLEKYYKLLRPNYRGYVEDSFGFESEMTQNLDNFVLKLKSKFSVMTQEDFFVASEEFYNLVRSLNDLFLEKVNGASRGKLQAKVNSLNKIEVQILSRWIFPKVKALKIKKLSASEMKEFKEIYKSELEESEIH